MAERYSLDDALYLMARLRDRTDGCPWDIKQQYADIVPYTLEECYELADAIAQGDMEHTEEELGDVLFQVIFYAQLGAEDGNFNFQTIVHRLVDKLVRRHPHVFPNGQLRQRFGAQTKNTDAIKASWETIKRDERETKQQAGVLDDVPLALPALTRARKLQQRAATVGMDWAGLTPIFDTLATELQELQQAIATGASTQIQDEAGDVLFTVVNIIRHLQLDAETALRAANDKFSQRISAMEQQCQHDKTSLAALTDTQREALWQLAKTSMQR